MAPEYLTKAELMAVLKISLQTVNRLMKQGLPYHRLGRRILFAAEDIEAFMQKHRVTSQKKD